MKKNPYFKILMAPLLVLTLGACSSELYNQSQESDDIYFTKSDRKKAPLIVEKVISEPIAIPEKEVVEIDKTYSLEEYSPEYVDPSIVNKYNNQETYSQVNNFGTRINSATQLNYSDFIWDYEKSNVRFKDLPLDWGTGYWSQIQFDNRVASDYQFRNAWYDYYYRGYEGTIENYFNQISSRQNYAMNSGFNTSFFYRTRLNFNFGFNTAFIPNYNLYYNQIYDPYGFYGNPFYGYNSPFYIRAGIFFGAAFWCPPSYGYRPGINSYPYYPSNIGEGNNGNQREVVSGPRNGRRVVTSLRDDVSNGTANTPLTRSQATLNSRSLNAANLKTSTTTKNGRAFNSRSVTNGRVDRSAATTEFGNARSSLNNQRGSGTRSNSRLSRVSTKDYNFDSRVKTRSATSLRSRSSSLSKSGTSNKYSRSNRTSFDNPSRRTNGLSEFSRSIYSPKRTTSSRSNSYSSRPSTKSRSSSFNRSPSSSRSSGNSGRSSLSRSGSSSSRSGVSRSTRSTTSSKSRSSLKKNRE